MLSGRIIAESLPLGYDLRIPSLRLVRVIREDVSASRSDTQPDVFTVFDVEGPDESADALTAALADALLEGPDWYADFRVGGDHVVVFPRRVFRYAVGDVDGRNQAVEYGRRLGIPEPQLDWGD